jgi:hypothetical protein
MKPFLKKLPLALSLIVAIFMAMSFNKEDKCVNQSMSKEVTERLKKYTLIDNFPFHLKEKKKKDPVEYKKQVITLNRGVKYKFYAIRNSEYEGLPIVTIYNNEKMEFLIASTYNFNMKKFYNEVEFECKSTGNYCLAMGFLDGMEGCALGVHASLIKE